MVAAKSTRKKATAKKAIRATQGITVGKYSRGEIAQLKQELNRFIKENKKLDDFVDVYSRSTHNEPLKYEFIKQNRHKYPVVLLCEVAGVTRSSYYRWLATFKERQRRARLRRQAEERLANEIKKIGEKSDYTYGRRRIKQYLEKVRKIHVGERRVARIMRQINYGR